MNIRIFNHNPPYGTKYPIEFNSRHYFARNPKQIKDKLTGRGNNNNAVYKSKLKRFYEKCNHNMAISSNQLHYDDGSELNHDPKMNWAEFLTW
ncbi:MAG: hypothetical protein GTO02_18320 [Candidatus Dadabacteria bacterium]|nr:hypothetical protein [Candidatus Dadabacteria bacterium]